jgi:metal-sulfur cluster biosynthetic enzyme
LAGIMNSKPELPARDNMLAALRTVVDPEIGLNIVDLGLIYDLSILGTTVHVTFTLTSPGCPLQFAMAAGIRHAILELASVEECEVRLVWEPPWDPSKISPEGRAFLSQLD